MRDQDLAVVIPSRRRVESCRRAHQLAPSARICVAQEEAADYAEFGRALVTHPDSVTGVAAVRTWVLRHWQERAVVILDDDVHRVKCLVGRHARDIEDPGAIRRILLNAAEIAEGVGAVLFSFAITPNILEFMPDDPFGFIKVNGPCLGFVGRDCLPDLVLHHNTDGDLTLQGLLKVRRNWQDTRFMFEHRIMTNQGGNRHMISNETWARDRAHLRRKWGPYIDEQESGGVTRIVVRNITRRQKLAL
jgi:hypothetical protein